MASREKPIQLPTDKEMSLVLSRIKRPRDQLMFILGIRLGLRSSEIANLRLSDVNLENKTVSFIGKGTKPATLPLTDEILGYLERAQKFRPTNHTHDFVIWNLRGNKGITRFGVYYLIKKYGQDAGAIKLYPHLLRHIFGTDLFKKTGDIYKTKEGLRHTRLTSTERYTHPDVEDLREDFKLLDSRNWLIRFLSKFKPPILNFSIEKPIPIFTGDTIARKTELEKINKNLKAGIHTGLCGARGSGKSHLLSQIKGENIYYLDEIKPAREKLIELCEKMKENGDLSEVPKGRSTSTLVKSLTESLEGKQYTLVIDSISDITNDGISLLRKLKEHCFTIFTSTDIKNRKKLKDIFFGSQDIIDLDNLRSKDAYKLAEIASVDLPTLPEERELFLKRVVAESKGNPKAIMEIIEKESKRGGLVDASTEISHEAIQEPLPATLFLSTFLIIFVVSRYVTSTLGLPDWKIILIIAIVILAVLICVDKILKQEIQ